MDLLDFDPGRWVVPIWGRQKNFAGRVSEINHVFRRVVVQFGADGPFRSYKPNALRFAHPDEIPEGVG